MFRFITNKITCKKQVIYKTNLLLAKNKRLCEKLKKDQIAQ